MTDDEERDLKMVLMRADTDLKREQVRWEPWKALLAAFEAGVAVATGLIAAAAWAIGHLSR